MWQAYVKRGEVGRYHRTGYDGHMWQHFQYDSAGRPFLAVPMNYLLMLNCDWFQPYCNVCSWVAELMHSATFQAA